MTRFLKHGMAAVLAVMLAACMPPSGIPYSTSFENIDKMKKVAAGAVKLRIGDFILSKDATVSLQCRLAGKLDVSPGTTIPDFVKEAVQKEFAAAGLYDHAATNAVSMNIHSIDLKSFTNASWSISVHISSNSYAGYPITINHPFQDTFDGFKACSLAASSFGSAVRQLIGAMIDHPDFAKLIGVSEQ